MRLERAGGIGFCPAEKRELDQRVRPGVADRLDGVSNQSAAALRPAAVAAQMVRWARGRAGLRCQQPGLLPAADRVVDDRPGNVPDPACVLAGRGGLCDGDSAGGVLADRCEPRALGQ